jgi:hypothetical protein
MPFLIYMAVVLVTLFGVILEMNVLVEPARHFERSTLVTQRATPSAAPVPVAQKQASKAVPLPPQPEVKQANVNAPAALDNAAPAKEQAAPATPSAVSAAAAATTVETPPTANAADAQAPSVGVDSPPAAIAVEEPPAPKCDVAACETAYFTFTPSDCTYQPSNGPRRLCTKGTPPSVSADATPAINASAASAQASAKCNQSACAQAYFTFNPADCTYRPSNGPRRICTK